MSSLPTPAPSDNRPEWAKFFRDAVLDYDLSDRIREAAILREERRAWHEEGDAPPDDFAREWWASMTREASPFDDRPEWTEWDFSAAYEPRDDPDHDPESPPWSL